MSNTSKGKRGSLSQKGSKASLTRRGHSKERLSSKKSSSTDMSSKDEIEGEKHSLADEEEVGGAKEAEISFVFRFLTEDDSRSVVEAETPEDLEKILVRVLELQSLDYDLGDNITLDCYTTAMWWSHRESLNIEQTSALFTIVHILLDNIGKGLTVRENLSELHRMFIGLTTVRKSSSSSSTATAVSAAATAAAATAAPRTSGTAAGQRPTAASAGNVAEQARATVASRITVSAAGQETGLSGDGSGDGMTQGVFTVHQADLLASYLCKTLFQHYHLYYNVYNCSRRPHTVCKQIVINTPPASLWPPPLMDSIPESVDNKYIDCCTGQVRCYADIAAAEQAVTAAAAAESAEGEGHVAAAAAVEEEEKQLSPEEQQLLEQQLLGRMSPADVHRIIEEVFGDMLQGLEKDVMERLQAQAQDYITRINRVYIPDC